jgi:hypothetical protein
VRAFEEALPYAAVPRPDVDSGCVIWAGNNRVDGSSDNHRHPKLSELCPLHCGKSWNSTSRSSSIESEDKGSAPLVSASPALHGTS